MKLCWVLLFAELALSQQRHTLPEVPSPVEGSRKLYMRGGFSVWLPKDWVYSLERKDRQFMQFGTADDGEGFQIWITIRVYDAQEVMKDSIEASSDLLKLYRRYQKDARDATRWSDSQGYEIALPQGVLDSLNAKDGVYSRGIVIGRSSRRTERLYHFVAMKPNNASVLVALLGVVVIPQGKFGEDSESEKRVKLLEQVGFSFRFD